MSRPWTINVLALCLTGCAQDVLTSISTITDEFSQSVAAQIDVLWVVDNSESMAEEQAGLGQSFAAFIDNLATSQVDYNIGVVSTDTSEGGVLNTGSAATPVITPTTANVASAFLQNIKVGTTGARNERAFESMAMALGKGASWQPGEAATPPNPGFLREDAALFIIAVSDEDDNSFGPVTYYRRLIESYKGAGNEARVSFSAIVGPPGETGGCYAANRGSAAPGDRYVDLAGQTGGIWASICADFTESLRELSITAAGLRSVFTLSRIPIGSGLIRNCDDAGTEGFCVRIDGEPLHWDFGRNWLYDDVQNAIVFGVNAIPPPQARITVEYLEAR